MRISTLIYKSLISLFCLLAVAINITWTTLPITIPFSCSGVITALDVNTDLVWIIGGFRESGATDAIYQWNMTSGDSFTQMGALFPYGYKWNKTYVHAQSWVTRHNIIYWVYSEHIHSFNMSSAMEIANDLDASFPYRKYDRPCVTTDDDKYLIVTGGRMDNFIGGSTRIYNFETNEWLPNMPNLNEARYEHSCNVYKGSVYAIGGYKPSKTIEKLDLNTLSNWITSSHQLIIGRVYHRSVLINDFIVVTGGWSGFNDNDKYLKSVEIISMIDDSVTRATDLNFGVSIPGIIRGPMNNVIIIGGMTSSSPWVRTNKIQISHIANETIGALNTEATDDPNLSNQSTNAMIYLVVGVICFACFFIVCYLMWRKMRNSKNLQKKFGFISLS